VGAADTARLIASLELQNKLKPGIQSAFKDIGSLETRLGRIGQHVQSGIKSAGANLAKIGLVAGAGLGVAIKSGLDDLAELESAVTSVDGAIEALGLQGQVTGKQIAGWANDIERDIGAAFDDKAITQAATTLLRFGKVTPKNLKPALEVMTDLATKTGSVDSAASLLAKALADPEKAAGKLARTGVILTKQQQDQIKAMVKAGDVAGAQALILDTLAESTKGAAAASQGPYQRALSILADVSEDAKKALAEGFLPVIEKVAKVLGEKLADPAVIADIRGMGQGLAGALDKAFDFATKIPWSTVGDAMKLAGQGAKAALGFFTSLPPWVQTAVITGWGLNKLTGGALGGIIGELGKGLVKGVLGMNAGVVNARAGVVNVAGGIGGAGAAGAAGAGGKAAGALGVVSKVFIAGAAAVAFAAVVSELKGIRDEQSKGNLAGAAALGTQTVKFAGEADLKDMVSSLDGIKADQKRLTEGLTPEAIAYQLNIDGVRDAVDASARTLQTAIEKANTKALTSITPGEIKTHTGLDKLDAQAQSQLRALFENTGVTRTTGDYVADQIKRNKEATDKAKAAVDQVKFATDATKAAIGTVRTAVGGATAAVKLGADRSVNETARVKAAVERAKAAVATVTSAVGTAKAAIDTVRTAVGGTTTAIKRKDLSFNLTQNNNISSRLFVNGYQMQVELDRSTTVIRGVSGGQGIS
jgi:hypothetical protein